MSIDQPRLNYENVEGLPAGPTLEQEAFASIAQSLKRIADRITRTEISRASAGRWEVRTVYKPGFGPADGADAVSHIERVNHGVVTGVYDEDGNHRPWPPAQPAPAAEGGDDGRLFASLGGGSVTGSRALNQDAIDAREASGPAPPSDDLTNEQKLVNQIRHLHERLADATARIRELEGERDVLAKAVDGQQNAIDRYCDGRLKTPALRAAESSLAALREKVKPVITWLENGCETKHAIAELRALLTDHAPDDQPARGDDSPVPAPDLGSRNSCEDQRSF